MSWEPEQDHLRHQEDTLEPGWGTAVEAENADLRRRLQDAEKMICELKANNDRLRDGIASIHSHITNFVNSLTPNIVGQGDGASAEGNAWMNTEIAQQREPVYGMQEQNNRSLGKTTDSRKQITETESTEKPRRLSRAVRRRLRRRNASTLLASASTTAQTPNIASSGPSCVAANMIESKLILDDNITTEVIEHLRKVFSEPKDEFIAMDFLFGGKPGPYYCFHEIYEKGSWAEKQLHPNQSECDVRSENCKFMIRVVTVCSMRKLQIFNPSASEQVPVLRELYE